MSMQKQTMTIQIGEETLHFETGVIARHANGAVVVRAGETMVFCAVTAAAQPVEDANFFPLRVDYQEKFFSAGKTVGGFIKREGKPTEREVLICRLIDRPIRPMFEEGYYNEVQILSYVWSYDGINSPEPLAICGASAALSISDIPFLKPLGAVRVGMVNGQFILNPTVPHQKESSLDLIIAGTADAVLMIEGYCDFLTEEQVLEAISLGHAGIKTFCDALQKWQNEVGKPKNRDHLRVLPPLTLEAVENIAKPLLQVALRIGNKKAREKAIANVDALVYQTLCPEEESEHKKLDVTAALKKITSKYMRSMILDEDARSDGRTSKEIRPITIHQGLLPRVHGSSLFTRGETQALVVCTLGGENMAQRFEDLDGEGANRFYLQYVFPPFSVGEVGRVGPPGRREIGHGKLAERALKAMMPKKDFFPYTVRLESTITESNGSSSMASVCGGTLSLMDAGAPVKRPVAGIAMGLIIEGERCIILSDILGIEDALGDMDFKIAGDQTGITAFQMDIKVEKITIDIMRDALAQAKEGRNHILNKMLEICPSPKAEMSVYAPRIETMQIKPSKIAIVIGPGGKQIRSIIEECGVDIDINDDGWVSISSSTLEGIEKAKGIIAGLTAEVEIGNVYTGKVMSVVPFGVFVEILPGKEGLCHISEFDLMRIENLNNHVKVGDIITVKVLEINDRGQFRLSRKALLAQKGTS
jgi:polyribonucleotide nucleotidyltransferase